jgi:ferredoxin
MTRRARLTVDPIACDGRGLCAELLPELVRLDDWGFPVITDAEVPAGLRGEVAAAVRLCPRLALRLARSGDSGSGDAGSGGHWSAAGS